MNKVTKEFRTRCELIERLNLTLEVARVSGKSVNTIRDIISRAVRQGGIIEEQQYYEIIRAQNIVFLQFWKMDEIMDDLKAEVKNIPEQFEDSTIDMETNNYSLYCIVRYKINEKKEIVDCKIGKTKTVDLSRVHQVRKELSIPQDSDAEIYKIIYNVPEIAETFTHNLFEQHRITKKIDGSKHIPKEQFYWNIDIKNYFDTMDATKICKKMDKEFDIVVAKAYKEKRQKGGY